MIFHTMNSYQKSIYVTVVGMSYWGNMCDKYDKRKININAAIRHYNLGIASKSEIALIKKKFKVIQNNTNPGKLYLRILCF